MTYQGLPADTVAFLADLTDHNDKAWFDAHRDRYETAYKQAGIDFIEAMAPLVADLSPHVVAEPRLNGSLRRIHRDTRFSQDKTPYKDHLDIIFSDERSPSMAFFFRLKADALMVGGGCYQFDKPTLDRWRQAVLRDGDRIAAILAGLRALDAETHMEPLKRVPRGFDHDHPHAELLKLKSVGLVQAMPVPDVLFTPDAPAHVASLMRPYRPLVDLLATL
ncbi:MAG: DUF2461 domain-containing protein [Alphaproteobacteria bacterium]|nr:DUF2461 domain-containing protein [Alphaproteobacteria bacterium]